MSTTTLASRQLLHRLVDSLPEKDLPTARRVLEALRFINDPVALALRDAPLDDEPDDDDFDGGLTEARREADEGEVVSHEEAKAILGLG